MKSKIYQILLASSCCLLPLPGHAQKQINKASFWKSSYFNIDWQANGLIGSDFINKISGWGAHFEMGHYQTANFAIGGFISYHTNNEYLPYQTFIWENSALSTEQQHSLFQIPFGISARYRLSGQYAIPYIGAKIGAQYTQSEDYIHRTCVCIRTTGAFTSLRKSEWRSILLPKNASVFIWPVITVLPPMNMVYYGIITSIHKTTDSAPVSLSNSSYNASINCKKRALRNSESPLSFHISAQITADGMPPAEWHRTCG